MLAETQAEAYAAAEALSKAITYSDIGKPLLTVADAVAANSFFYRPSDTKETGPEV